MVPVILNKKACPSHALCLFPCPTSSAERLQVPKSCLPGVKEAGHKGHRCYNSISVKSLGWANPGTESRFVVARPRRGENGYGVSF